MNIIEELHENIKYILIIDGKLTQWFDVLAEVSQGCFILSTVFNIFFDFVMLEVKSLFKELQLHDTSLGMAIKCTKR